MDVNQQRELKMNNFDQSSSGINLDLTVFFDTNYSQTLFDDNMQRDNYNSELWHYTNYDQHSVTDLLSIDSYANVTKKALIDLIEDKSNLNLITGLFEFDAMQDCADYHNTYKSRLTKVQLWEYYTETSDYSEVVDKLCDTFSPKFLKVYSLGYSQGGSIECVIPEKLLSECPTMTPNKWKDLIHNLTFRAPLYVSLMIDGEDSAIDSHISDLYSYDKEELLEIIEKEAEGMGYVNDDLTYILEWCNDNLPEYPNHI